MTSACAPALGAPLLPGRTALVTGGSRGLGRAISARFAADGAKVAFTYAHDEHAALEALRSIEAAGGVARAFATSVLDAAGSATLVAQIEKDWGAVDILVNNAGLTHQLPLALLDEEDFDAVMDVNVKGVFVTTRAAVKGMIRRRRGAILNIGSLAGVRMLEAPIHYCASKAALTGLTQALAKELARYQVRVNCLAPGLLEDGLGKNLPDYRLAEYLRHCALGRVGTFDEVARTAAFLVSDRNTYMNGATLVMDGGV